MKLRILIVFVSVLFSCETKASGQLVRHVLGLVDEQDSLRSIQLFKDYSGDQFLGALLDSFPHENEWRYLVFEIDENTVFEDINEEFVASRLLKGRLVTDLHRYEFVPGSEPHVWKNFGTRLGSMPGESVIYFSSERLEKRILNLQNQIIRGIYNDDPRELKNMVDMLADAKSRTYPVVIDDYTYAFGELIKVEFSILDSGFIEKIFSTGENVVYRVENRIVPGGKDQFGNLFDLSTYNVVEDENLSRRLQEMEKPRLGLNLRIVEEGFQIVRVVKQSAGEAFGFKEGDIILGINGSNLVGSSVEDLFEAMGDEIIVEILFRREGSVIEVEVPLWNRYDEVKNYFESQFNTPTH